MFRLPRRRREPFDDNRAQIHHLTEMENNLMAALEAAVEELRSAIASANDRFANVADFQAKLDAERAKFDALVSAEAAEDVAQNQELADARAATDAALAEVQGAADAVSGLTDQVNNLGTVAAAPPVVDGGDLGDAPVDAAPVEAAPVEVPEEAPVAETPVEAPADAPVDTPAPVEDVPAPAGPVSGGAPTPDVDPQSTTALTPDL